MVFHMQSMRNELEQLPSFQFESVTSRIEALENQSAFKATVDPPSPE
jgi:hypothetical protein